jgi:hypothetical protein
MDLRELGVDQVFGDGPRKMGKLCHGVVLLLRVSPQRLNRDAANCRDGCVMARATWVCHGPDHDQVGDRCRGRAEIHADHHCGLSHEDAAEAGWTVSEASTKL